MTRDLVREFTVAVFVVHEGRVLLHWHRKLQRWLPPGGHIEAGELPDEAAIRETQEETGLDIELVDAPLAPGAGTKDAGAPQRLTQPLGIQLEDIAPGHQHIDLIYLARVRPGSSPTPVHAAGDPESRPAWFAPDDDDWESLGLTAEVAGWARAAVVALDAGAPRATAHELP